MTAAVPDPRFRDQLAEITGCAPLADSGGAVWCETHGDDWPCKVGRIEALVERLSEALRFIDRNGCETFTRGRCLDANSGRTRDAQYGADRWCDPCIAAAALAALRGDRAPLAEQQGDTRPPYYEPSAPAIRLPLAGQHTTDEEGR